MSDLENNGLTGEGTELNKENNVSEEDMNLLEDEEVKEEIVEINEIEKDKMENTKGEDKKTSFGDLFIANFIDIMAISAISFVILFIFELIIKLAGYKVADKMTMYLIMFIVTSLFYSPIFNKTKIGTTIGNKLFYLSLKRDK